MWECNNLTGYTKIIILVQYVNVKYMFKYKRQKINKCINIISRM